MLIKYKNETFGDTIYKKSTDMNKYPHPDFHSHPTQLLIIQTLT